MGAKKRKQITFDLSQKSLKQFYPHNEKSLNLLYYKKAYADINRFMKKNGFEHRQFSVYVSVKKHTATDINLLIYDLSKEFTWFKKCVTQIDVTDIGTQHSLLYLLENAEQTESLHHIKPERAETKSLDNCDLVKSFQGAQHGYCDMQAEEELER